LQKSAAQLFTDKLPAAECALLTLLRETQKFPRRHQAQNLLSISSSSSKSDCGATWVSSCSLLINPRLFAIIGTQKNVASNRLRPWAAMAHSVFLSAAPRARAFSLFL